MELYGNGRVALVDDPVTAGKLEWLAAQAVRPGAGDPAGAR